MWLKIKLLSLCNIFQIHLEQISVFPCALTVCAFFCTPTLSCNNPHQVIITLGWLSSVEANQTRMCN